MESHGLIITFYEEIIREVEEMKKISKKEKMRLMESLWDFIFNQIKVYKEHLSG